MKTAEVLQEIIEMLKQTDTDKSELVFKVSGNRVALVGVEKLKNSNNIILNLQVPLKGKG